MTGPHPTGNSRQILQGLSGMYSGGLWGEGFGQGHPEYTPIALSDVIYSGIGEELGFAGCILLVIVFLVLFSRGFGIADQTRALWTQGLCGTDNRAGNADLPQSRRRDQNHPTNRNRAALHQSGRKQSADQFHQSGSALGHHRWCRAWHAQTPNVTSGQKVQSGRTQAQGLWSTIHG
jgi:hypothetical protein